MTAIAEPLPRSEESQRRSLIGLLNLAHAVDHFVILIYPTVVIGLEAVYARSYAELIALSTASFIAFGVFSLPAGWLADRWSRRNMMIAFYLGCGASLIAAGLAPNLTMLAVALFALGIFASIYHPVGMAALIAAATSRGRTLAFNGVCGNLGAALASGITALLATAISWRAAFVIPGLFCIAIGFAYMRLVPTDTGAAAKRRTESDVPLGWRQAAILFVLFMLLALTTGVVFNTVSVALPKIVDERLGQSLPLFVVGGLATAVFMCGALAQLAVGRLVERFPPHVLLALVVALQVAGVAWAATARGVSLLAALALTMAALYAQVTVNDVVIARYTADAWRGRVYAVRYFLTFLTSGLAVSAIAFLYKRGGFDLVLGATAIASAVILATAIGVAMVVGGIETRVRRDAQQPAE